MKSLQEQINEQIEFCKKVLSENRNVTDISVRINGASPSDLYEMQIVFKDIEQGVDKSHDGKCLRLHLNDMDSGFCIFIYSVPVKINTQITYETL